MTISSLNAAAIDPHASGFGLLRLAARNGAAEVAPVERTRPAGSCDCGQADCPTCSKSVFAAEDTVELSLSAAFESGNASPEFVERPEAIDQTDNHRNREQAGKTARASDRASSETELTDEEQKQVEQLKQRDREVRQHEQAHLAAAGGNAIGGPTFEYQTGPDGKRYAVGGEVQIDTSPVEGDPEATIAKMQQIRAAALAPANPSAQDRQVAAQAAAEARDARAELARSPSGFANEEQNGASLATGQSRREESDRRTEQDSSSRRFEGRVARYRDRMAEPARLDLYA